MTTRMDLRPLFAPQSVAIVGASPSNPAAHDALVNFQQLPFDGRVGAVNPRYDEVLGFPCVPSLSDLDFVPETVVACVNRDRALTTLEEAAELGSRAAVVFGIGFGERDEDGKGRQERLETVARDAGLAVLGPNCQGLINFDARIALYLNDVRPYEPGAVGLISQSGSITTALTNNERGVRWRYIVSSGNEAVVRAADLLDYMIEDEECRVVCMFLEAIRDPDRFFAACDRAADRDLPLVVLKTGRTEAAVRAAAAHSGALGAPDKLVQALFERHGVIRVDTLEEMLETAKAMQASRRPTRPHVATLTASGGHVEMALDTAAAVGLEHPRLADETVRALEQILPDFLEAQNPLDWWGVADEDEDYPKLLQVIADDPAIDIMISIIDQTLEPTGDGRFQPALDTAIELAAGRNELLVLLDGIGGVSHPENVDKVAAAGALLLSGFETGMRALRHLVEYARRAMGPRPARPDLAPDPNASPPRSDPFAGQAALGYLAAAGVPVVQSRTVRSLDEASAVAEELGYPVVAKSADESITHKTEAGGVITGIETPELLAKAMERLAGVGDGSVALQPQLAGIELIVGMTRHDELGSFLVLGLGGIWTEVLKDVVFAPVGLADGEAEALLRRLRGYSLLEGARGTEPVDLAAVVDIVRKLDALAIGLGDRVAGIDINPVIATPNGATAVDALVVPSAPEGAPGDSANVSLVSAGGS